MRALEKVKGRLAYVVLSCALAGFVYIYSTHLKPKSGADSRGSVSGPHRQLASINAFRLALKSGSLAGNGVRSEKGLEIVSGRDLDYFRKRMQRDKEFNQRYAALGNDTMGQELKLLYFLNQRRGRDPRASSLQKQWIQRLKEHPESGIALAQAGLERLPTGEGNAIDRAGLISLMSVISPGSAETTAAALDELAVIDVPARQTEESIRAEGMGPSLADTGLTVEARVAMGAFLEFSEKSDPNFVSALADLIHRQHDLLLRNHLYRMAVAGRTEDRGMLDQDLHDLGTNPFAILLFR